MNPFSTGERLLVSIPVYAVTAISSDLYSIEPAVTMTQILDFQRAGYVIVNRFPAGPNNAFVVYDLRRMF